MSRFIHRSHLQLVEPTDEFGDALPLEVQREHARDYLGRLVARDLVGLVAEEDPAACDDCGKVRRRYRYGRLAVCLYCSLARRRVALRKAA